MPKRSKFGNCKTELDGFKFDSKREAARYSELKLLQLGRKISGLRRQVPYECVVNGMLVCKYIADFVYLDERGDTVVEDVKGYRTEVYKLKRKLVRAVHGVEIIEV